MIFSFRGRRAQAFAEGAFVREFQGFDRQAWKCLEILEAATSLDELRALPSNRLEALRGDRRGQHRIRINEQWRICFEWPKGAAGPSNVEIMDCHQEAGEQHGTVPDPSGEILADELREIVVTPTELARQIACSRTG